MKLRLKPLDEQVMVITGASTGIGLVTAKHAARPTRAVLRRRATVLSLAGWQWASRLSQSHDASRR
jgi:NAD(P)-dependent dehydrogenase (short-subunit alcohol dehydrogenase family)